MRQHPSLREWNQLGRKAMRWNFMQLRYFIQQRLQLLSNTTFRLPSWCLLGWFQMCLHHKLLPRWYDLGKLPMQEQLNQMHWRYLRIQQHLHHPFKQMPIRFGLEQQQRLHTNQQRLPIRIILQRSQVRPIHFMRQRKSLE